MLHKNIINNTLLQERTTVLTEWKERPFIRKESRVIEEVKIKRKVIARSENISETLRKTEIHINEIQPET